MDKTEQSRLTNFRAALTAILKYVQWKKPRTAEETALAMQFIGAVCREALEAEKAALQD